MRPAVVSVVVEVQTQDFFGRVFTSTQSGSGVIFDTDGFILTNNHVVQGAQSITVTLDDGRQFDALIVGTDPLTDLAVIKMDSESFPFANFGDPFKVRVGDWVVAIGNALALPGGPTVTVGVISALGRSVQVSQDVQLYGLIQTDASINPGNSGGPLLNLDGEVVGINTLVTRGDGAGTPIEGIGFAVGMDTAVPVTTDLIALDQVRWAWLGVVLDDLNPQTAAEAGLPIRGGVFIADVVQGGPDWDGGIRSGDVVVSIEGEDVPTARDLIALLRQRLKAGGEVEITVVRSGNQIVLNVTLGERPAP